MWNLLRVPTFMYNVGHNANPGTDRSWLRHCATSWMVAGSIPDVVIGIFHRRNPFCLTIALGSTHPLTEISKVNQSHYRPEVPRGFQEVKVPRLRDNGPEWW